MIKNKIYNLDVCNFLEKIDDNSIDLIIADPPYNIGIDKWDKFKSDSDYWKFMYKWISFAIKKLKDNGSIYIFNNQKNSAILLTYLLKKGVHFNNWITWYKKDGFHPTKTKFVNNQETILFMSKGKPKIFNFDAVRMPYLSTKRFNAKNGIKAKNGNRWIPNKNGKLCTDVWEISSERHNLKNNGKLVKLCHPTIKPTKIIERIILASSKQNDLILDLFSGSGQTSICAKKLGRNFIGCEINKKFYDSCLERLKND